MQPIQKALLSADAYPHAVDNVRLIETHLSWVFLTGELAYKVKKPVCFDFVDFSTLELRRHFCEEEVRCNQAFAPELYVAVVGIAETSTGGLRIVADPPPDAEGVVDYAVCMRQFDPQLQADRLLARGELGLDEMHRFGERLAAQHVQLPELDLAYEPGEAILDNFATIRATRMGADFDEQLQVLESTAREQLAEYMPLLMQRRDRHFVRECHGDLHLSNLARLEQGITAFDCLEFDESLRNIDFWCDSGFLFMDCCVRDREDLGYGFIDGYLNVSGDYGGVCLLPLFAEYRSVVRAKVAVLRYQQTGEDHDRERLEMHLRWPRIRHDRPVGKLWLTCGLSGSGKSYWAQRLVPKLPAIRMRSDVLRKVQHGLTPEQKSGSGIGQGLYQPQRSVEVYEQLAALAVPLLTQGEQVIVDAACLRAEQRHVLYDAARSAGAATGLLYCTAPEAVLRERIEARQRQGGDPSEADVSVLEWQLTHFEAPGSDEPVVAVDTTAMTIEALLAATGQ